MLRLRVTHLPGGLPIRFGAKLAGAIGVGSAVESRILKWRARHLPRSAPMRFDRSWESGIRATQK
jgi:hypothetical protein